MTHDSSDIGTIVHLPECPAPLCDWGLPDGECMGYEDCHHLCCCGALRACEQRVRMEDDDYAYVAAQVEADGRRRGWSEALDAAREAVARQCGHTKSVSTNYECDHDRAIAAINALQDALQDDLLRYE